MKETVEGVSVNQCVDGVGEMARVLIIDDEADIRDGFAMILERSGYVVATAANGRDGVFLHRGSPVDVVITDLFMPVQCQRRSEASPVGRSKTRPHWVKPREVLRVVPVVHRRDPRCFV